MEDEAKDSLRSLLGRGTLLALASSGCWECQCTLRESDEVDPLYRAEQSLHFLPLRGALETDGVDGKAGVRHW